MQAFQWPQFDFKGDTDVEMPGWVQQEIKDGGIRVSDDLAYVRIPKGDWATVHAGEWIVKMNGNLYVCSDELFAQMTRGADDEITRTASPNPHNAQVEGADAGLDFNNANFSGGPPYSSAVLARSAAAREQQAIYDAQQAANPKSNP